MKLSDYIADFIAKQQVKHVFLISGGAIIHCVDSVAKHPELSFICTQHEQGAGAAADMYSRVTGNIGVTMVTSGPGATNLVTSVCNAFFDSIPMLVISGQVAKFRIRPNENLRQKGFQETDIVAIFKSITKYSKLLLEPNDIRYELEKALYLARNGRPGPVLLDIPDDLQRAEVDPKKLKSFSSSKFAREEVLPSKDEVLKFVSLIRESKKPALILGAGIHISKTEKEVVEFAEHFGLPILLTWGGMDLLPHSHALNMGGVGVVGPRGGNFAVQVADLVIGLGTRMSQMITGGKQDLFAPRAKKVMVDIDIEEIKKFGPDTFSLDLAIQSDLKAFFKALSSYLKESVPDQFFSWRETIKDWNQKYPNVLPEYYNRRERVDAHVFVRELFRSSQPGNIIITDAGGNLSWTMQACAVKDNQKLYSAWNHSPMGYSMPASIGAALADPKTEVLCIIGDGGIMMCLEELATIRRYNLSVKIFIFNNRGHGIQKQTIETWLHSHYVAVDHETGLYFPNFKKLADAFELPYESIENHNHLQSKLKTILNTRGPVLCNVEIAEDQRIVPMLKFGAGLEDLDPKLPREEIDKILNF